MTRSTACRRVFIALVFLLPTAALACEQELAALDARLAENPPTEPMQAMMVQRMREAAAQMCAMGQDEAARKLIAKMTEAVPSLAGGPTGSVADQAATSPAYEGIWIDRPENMAVFWFEDMDLHDGDARFLYRTSPSLPQGQTGNWTVNLYVATMTPDGEETNDRLYSRKAMEFAAMRLRPGREQVLVQRNPASGGMPGKLETWSIPGGDVVSAAKLPRPFGSAEERWDWSSFKSVTTDGNAVFTTTQFRRNRNGPDASTAAWFEMTPGGKVVGAGRHDLADARQMITNWFPAHGGGIGLALDMHATGDTGISDPEQELAFDVGGRTVDGIIGREKRLVITGADPADFDFSPALERDIRWGGGVAIPQDLPAAEMMRQNRQQLQTMSTTEIEYGGRRHVDVLKPTSRAYGALIRVLAGGASQEDSVDGEHFIEIDADRVLRDIHLEPLADELDVDFIDFSAPDSDRLYLLAETDRRGDIGARLLVLDANGDRQSSFPVTVPDEIELEGVIGDSDAAWIVGHGRRRATDKESLWVVPIATR